LDSTMKISAIEVIPLVRKLETEFLGGTYKITNRNTIVTRVRLGNGIVGECFGGDEDQTQQRIVALMRDHLIPMLIGEDVHDVERLWEKMFFCDVDLGNRALHVLDLGNRGVLMQAIAAIDNAFWDAIGKLHNTPVYKLLGGYRDRVPVIAIGGYYYPGAPTHRALCDEILAYKEQGLYGVKMKVGRVALAADVERVRAVREAVGDDFVVACDANMAWTPTHAIDFCRAVAPLNIRWMEEPVRWYDQLGGLRAVRDGSPIPVVAGQGEISRFGCRDLILHGGVQILNVDVTIAGGVTEWRRIAGLASHFAVQMAHHEESQVALHLLASIPHGLYVEIFPNLKRDPLWHEIQQTRPLIRDGYMHLNDQPGLGLDLNPEVIARYRVD
jgi:L-alanine-DL-glutamate epimerase-like enolase superfamily enzyme